MEPEHKEVTFATALNCMDGRVQNTVTEWTKKHFNVTFVDAVTEPGIDSIIRAENSYLRYIFQKLKKIFYLLRYLPPWNYKKFIDYDILSIPPDCNILRRKLMISIDNHQSKGVVICGHRGCAGNPASNEEHQKEIKEFCEEVAAKWNLSVPVYGLWIDEINGKWQVAKVVYMPHS